MKWMRKWQVASFCARYIRLFLSVIKSAANLSNRRIYSIFPCLSGTCTKADFCLQLCFKQTVYVAARPPRGAEIWVIGASTMGNFRGNRRVKNQVLFFNIDSFVPRKWFKFKHKLDIKTHSPRTWPFCLIFLKISIIKALIFDTHLYKK